MAEHRMIEAGAARIALTIDRPPGAPRGPAVVLLPSLGRGGEDYDEVAPLVAAAGFLVLRPEPRGIDGSTGPLTGITLVDLAADVAACIRAEGAAPALVIGHAFGNWVARVLAWSQPEVVRALSILAAVVGTEVAPDMRRSINGSFDPALTEAERLHHLQRGYFAPGHDARVWLAGWHPEVARAQRAATDALKDRGWLRAAERVRLHYVAAAEDAISPPPSLETLHAALGPLATMEVIPRAGHALLPEQPAAVAAAIVRFAGSV
jgi:pimeloyl-ACP methyl ester carboxylesterase